MSGSRPIRYILSGQERSPDSRRRAAALGWGWRAAWPGGMAPAGGGARGYRARGAVSPAASGTAPAPVPGWGWRAAWPGGMASADREVRGYRPSGALVGGVAVDRRVGGT